MSNIKINDVFQRIQYLATAGQTQFTVPFPFFENSYVYVWLNGIQIFPGGSPGEYTITGAGSPSGGLVTLNTAASLNDIVTISGIMPIDRTSIYSPTISNLTGSDLNGDFNREVVMMKQIQTTQSLLQLQYAPWSVISQDPDITTDRYIPLLQPLEAWRMNAAGTEIETFNTPDGSGLAPDDAEYILQTTNSNLPNAIALDSLGSGFMVNQSGTGLAALRALTGQSNQISVTNGNGVAGNPLLAIANNPIIPGTAGMGIPAGTTAERVIPTPPSIGLRFNTDSSTLEAYISGIWQIIPSSASGAFLPLAGGTMTGNINMDGNHILNALLANNALDTDLDADGNKITDLALPTVGTDAANKNYVDLTAAGRFFVEPVRVVADENFAATYDNGTSGVGATLTATVNGAATQDGVSLALNDRVLFWRRSNPIENGISTVTQVGDGSSPAIYTRATDYDTPSDIDPGDSVLVTEGNEYAQSGFMQTAVVVDIGTDPIEFTQFIYPNVANLVGNAGHFTKNLIIGGDFETNPWQRGTSFPSTAFPFASGLYTADRWRLSFSSTAVATIVKAADAPTVAQAGILSTSSLLHTITTADSTIAAADAYHIHQRIEGYNWTRLAQRPMTLSFWVKSSVTGIYCVAFTNGNDRSYVAEYTIDTANTWEYKTITVTPSPSSGTWNYSNGIGLIVAFVLAAGTNFQTTPNSWESGFYLATSNQVNNLGTIGNTFQFDLVQLESGTVATPFESRTIGQETTLCQRYFYKTFPQNVAPAQATGVAGSVGYRVTNTGVINQGMRSWNPVLMRGIPTITFYNPQNSGTAWYNQSAAANSGTSATLNVSDRGLFLNNSQVAGDTASHYVSIHLTKNAEL